MRKLVSVLLVLGGFAAHGACGTAPDTEYPSQLVQRPVAQVIGDGDQIELRVYYGGSQEIKQDYLIGQDGSINVPFIGQVSAVGKTKAELEKNVRERLADGYLVDPVVSVNVRSSAAKRLTIFGEVQKPGTMPYTAGMTIVDTISQAGGFTPLAKKNEVAVTRTEESQSRKYTIPVEEIGKNQAKMFMMQPGDVVFVPQRRW